MHGDPQAFADGIHPFVRLALDGYASGGRAEKFGEARTHGTGVRKQLGALADDRDIDIPDAIPGGGDLVHYGREQLRRIGSLPAHVGIGEMRSDVAERGGAEKRVGHGMQQNIRVGVPLQRGTLLDNHSSKLLFAPERFFSGSGEAVRIVSEADSHAAIREATVSDGGPGMAVSRS